MIKSSNLSRSVIVLAHNIRSTHNIGSLFRTCEGLGVEKLILGGYTPYPRVANDKRLPYIADAAEKAISKTALKAHKFLPWEHVDDVEKVIKKYSGRKYQIVALEQTDKAIDISQYIPSDKVLLILGNEVTGIEASILKLTNITIEIPMKGQKESFNVVQAAAMALFYLLPS